MKWMFICAHPDDLEYFVGYLMYHIANTRRNRDEIFVYSMTRGEMSDYTKITGSTKLAAKIRTAELRKSCSILGIGLPRFLGFFDGFVRVSEKAINKLYLLIKDVRPDIIVAPEPMFTYYYHTDHVRTGRIVFYAVQELIKDELKQSFTEQKSKGIKIPIILYFGALINNFYFPKKRKYRRAVKKALDAHVSQRKLLKQFAPINWLVSFIHGRKVPGAWMAEALRFQYVPAPARFGNNNTKNGVDVPETRMNLLVDAFYNKIKFTRERNYHMGLIRRILYYLGYKMEEGRKYDHMLRYIDGTLPPDVAF